MFKRIAIFVSLIGLFCACSEKGQMAENIAGSDLSREGKSCGETGDCDSAKLYLYASVMALDGTPVPNINKTSNIWRVNPDGSGNVPLTKLTAVGADCDAESPSPDGKKILFVSRRALDGSDGTNPGEAENIWVMNADGSEQKPLTKFTSQGVFGNRALWLPDGSKFLYLSSGNLQGADAMNRNGTVNIWVMNADGSSRKPLTDLTSDISEPSALSWSPDGTKIIYTSVRALDGSDAANNSSDPRKSGRLIFNLWTTDLNSGHSIPITKSSLTDSQAGQWSPDGLKVAYSSDRAIDGSDANNAGSSSNIWVLDMGTGLSKPLTRLTARGVFSTIYSWSNDSRKIYFVSSMAVDGSNSANYWRAGENSTSTYNIWAVTLDGTSPTPLTAYKAAAASIFTMVELPNFKLSPDGTKIVFDNIRALDGSVAYSQNLTKNLWIMDADGKNKRPLTRLTAKGANSRLLWWMDDGLILYISSRELIGADNVNEDGASNVWMMKADGTATFPITWCMDAAACPGDMSW